jgi:hypothetical protein
MTCCLVGWPALLLGPCLFFLRVLRLAGRDLPTAAEQPQSMVSPRAQDCATEIARDVGFLLLAVWLMVRPRSVASLDGWLTTRAPDVETVDTQGRT